MYCTTTILQMTSSLLLFCQMTIQKFCSGLLFVGLSSFTAVTMPLSAAEQEERYSVQWEELLRRHGVGTPASASAFSPQEYASPSPNILWRLRAAADSIAHHYSFQPRSGGEERGERSPPLPEPLRRCTHT